MYSYETGSGVALGFSLSISISSISISLSPLQKTDCFTSEDSTGQYTYSFF